MNTGQPIDQQYIDHVHIEPHTHKYICEYIYIYIYISFPSHRFLHTHKHIHIYGAISLTHLSVVEYHGCAIGIFVTL
jgi:hypothetical protein